VEEGKRVESGRGEESREWKRVGSAGILSQIDRRKRMGKERFVSPQVDTARRIEREG
jgi:hypothetical protein